MHKRKGRKKILLCPTGPIWDWQPEFTRTESETSSTRNVRVRWHGPMYEWIFWDKNLLSRRNVLSSPLAKRTDEGLLRFSVFVPLVVLVTNGIIRTLKDTYRDNCHPLPLQETKHLRQTKHLFQNKGQKPHPPRRYRCLTEKGKQHK